MNIQAMMKQAQKIQNDMVKEKKKIEEKEFEVTKSFVTIRALGNKKIISLKIDIEEFEDVEMLEDIIMITMNELMEKIDTETESCMEKYTKGMPGLF